MATIVDTVIQTSMNMYTSINVPVASLRGRYKEKTTRPPVKTTVKTTGKTTVQRIRETKYRHVFATHSLERSSCLSHDAEKSPNFVGFRNLMVLVLSTHSSPIRLALR